MRVAHALRHESLVELRRQRLWQVYWLYWYKSTNTDAVRGRRPNCDMSRECNCAANDSSSAASVFVLWYQ